MLLPLRLRYKFFLVLLAASIVTIACMIVLSYLSFQSGLIRFVDRMEMKRIQNICSILEEAYIQEGDWAFLKKSPEAWDRLQSYMFDRWRQNKDREHRLRIQDNNVAHHLTFGTPRPDDKYLNKVKRGRRPGFPRDVILMDKDGTPIFENLEKPDGMRLTPIVVDENTVGWIGTVPSEAITAGEELHFLKRQFRMFLAIAVAVLVLAVIIAIWSAYYLEGPIRELAKGTKKLTSGEYGIKIPVKSGDELGTLSRDFNILSRTLEENEKGRKQWVADIAHDLRTPLTLLSGEIEAIHDGLRQVTPDTLKRLDGDISHLIRLVNDLGELSRTDLGALSYKKENIDLADVLKETLEKFQAPFIQKGLVLEENITGHEPLPVFADTERLGRLFVNILQNSLSYTASGGKVKMAVSSEKDKVVVTVKDSAPGVPEEILPKLFDRLFRVDPSRSRDKGASGLGLAICKNIVDAHEGNISASHSELGGIMISVELPINV
jgi:two-component system sensor histidine kinase BaeS